MGKSSRSAISTIKLKIFLQIDIKQMSICKDIIIYSFAEKDNLYLKHKFFRINREFFKESILKHEDQWDLYTCELDQQWRKLHDEYYNHTSKYAHILTGQPLLSSLLYKKIPKTLINTISKFLN